MAPTELGCWRLDRARIHVDSLPAEDAEALKEWLQPVAEAVGAELLVTDDADGFKAVADELELKHQVCKSHVKRNAEVLVDNLASLAKAH